MTLFPSFERSKVFFLHPPSTLRGPAGICLAVQQPIPFRFILVCWEDEEMNFGIQLQRNSARSFRVGKVPALLGQAGKALFLMKSTLNPPCPGSRKEWLVGLKEFGRNVHGLVLEGETEFISSHGRRLSEASIWRLGLELQLVGLEASYSGLLVGQAGPPSSLRSNPSRLLWQPVLIALALIPVRGASARR